MVEMEWYKKLMKLAKQDPNYQICLTEVSQIEPEFMSLKDSLTEEQKKVLERYLTACDELDHALLMLAFVV